MKEDEVVKLSPLCGVAVVVVETAAEPLLPLNSSVGLPFRRGWDDELVVHTLMVSFRVIMNQEFTHGSPQGILTKENHPLQAFLFDRSYESFGESVQVRRARRKLYRVAVVDQEAVRFQDSVFAVGNVAADLFHP